MKDRQYLNKSILLCGESDGVIFKRTFTIVKKLSEGSFSICYEAFHGNSGRGVLKEFYPKEAYGLERDKHGQLIHSMEFKDAYERFLKDEKEYIEPYEMLLDIKQNNDNQDLATFIPSFEIYHGGDEAGNVIGTTYIWTPDPKLETFDKICDEIHKFPNDNPEYKLVTVLNAIETLTKCILALHSAGMIHRDIKPSNFGFVKRGEEILTQTLSMFDINSISSVYGEVEGMMGTRGYLEPEFGYEIPNNQTDIYSIGATLFHAIIVTDECENKDYLYHNEYYDRLHSLVKESKLIRTSEANSHPRLRNILTVILQKCLCERTYRYANCEELLDDLEVALYYALPSDVAGKHLSGERWVLADVEKSLDINKEKNSLLAIQFHLYKYPLYRCCSNEETTINVLVLGFGNYGQKFLDTGLQVGQIRNKKLNVTVISDDITDKEIYLSERPELTDFFNIDSSLIESEQTYGDITFETIRLERRDEAANADILQNIMYEYYDTKNLHYIFIALGEDELNYTAANVCKEVFKGLENDCIISYVCEENQNFECEESVLYPLYVNMDFKKSALFPEIERMAFNTHLVWEKNLNIDYNIIKADFKKRYNYEASFAGVLALKYKLYSVGIDLETTNFNDAACLFNEIISTKKNRNVKNELIWIEHRRWVTEKLCLGWRRIKNLEECVHGITKDESHKRHVCIIRSRPDQKLTTEYSINNNYDKWDTASKSELSQLDELDRMSVELHRMFVEKAKFARRHNLLSGNNIAAIKTLIEGDKKATVAFQEWFTCLKDIWNGDIGKVFLYKGLKNSFLNATENLFNAKRKSLREQVKAFETLFYPILASMEYRDWKQDDVAMIDNIPFILTYTEKAYLVIPFATGDNSNIFSNVAAATVVSPTRILYLYLVETEQDIKALLESVHYVIEYMKKKRLKAAVEFILLYTDDVHNLQNHDCAKKIKRIGGRRIRQVKSMMLTDMDIFSTELEAYLKQRSKGKKFFAVEKNMTRLSYMLQGAGFYNLFASYQFDSNLMKFNASSGSEMLIYITKKPYITVTDMMTFRLSTSENSKQPEFFADYKELWKMYCKKRGLWKLICSILREYANNNDVLASFKTEFGMKKKAKSQEYRYIMPFLCNKSVAKIIRFLIEQNILEQGSHVSGYTTDSCEAVIIDRWGYRTVYDRLFSNVYALMLPDTISFHNNSKIHEIRIMFDNLMVKEVRISGNRMKELTILMQFFRNKGYIINLTITHDGKMSFTYASRQIKELLTTAGKMLEVYTYHKVKELGYFDDVVSSFEIDWEKTEVKSEFDCILTKGFRSLFVECKARSNIEQEFYFKIASLVKQFGINATAVLVADTHEDSIYDNVNANTMQRKRGKMMDVVTIWKPDEISNIGHTLLNVINGTYVEVFNESVTEKFAQKEQ